MTLIADCVELVCRTSVGGLLTWFTTSHLGWLAPGTHGAV